MDLKLFDEFVDKFQACSKCNFENIFSGFNKGELGVLQLLSSKNKSFTSGELSEMLKVSTARVASILNSLEHKSLIVRKMDNIDKRKTLIEITEKGVILTQDIKDKIMKRIDYLIENLGRERFDEYLNLTMSISKILGNYEEETC